MVGGDLNDVKGWGAFASGGARCEVQEEEGALRIDYDFRGESGFLGIRRVLEGRLPDPFSFAFKIRGEAPANALEFKIADPSNENAWRWREDAFQPTREGRELVLRESAIGFAWGPAGGGRVRQSGAIEIVVAAGPGGQGTLWIEELRLIDRSIREQPAVTASSQGRNGSPGNVLTDERDAGWKPAAGDERPWLQLDFHEPREYGGVMIEWGVTRGRRALVIEASDTGTGWKRVYRSENSAGRRSFVPLPGGESRFLRLAFRGAVEIRRVEIQAFDFARTKDDLFASIAARTARGSFPRYLLWEQSYWTSTGVAHGVTCSLINEEGLVELDRGSFSIEPFLFADGRLITWADVKRSVRLEPGGLPIPTVRWLADSIALETTPFATGHGDEATLFIRYRLRNRAEERQRVKLIAAIRPHQVSPPWQRWKTIGGVSEIESIAWKQGVVWVNGEKGLIPLQPASGFGAMSFDEGLLTDVLREGKLPAHERVKDGQRLTSGALSFAVSLPGGGVRDLFLAAPFGKATAREMKRVATLDGGTEFEEAVRSFRDVTERVRFDVPAGVPRSAAEAFGTVAGQILINRDGPALQPGPRRYTRSWIRDGAIMGAALARAGHGAALEKFARWYAAFQREDGFVPCCVDRDGIDWLVEHDSHGQLIFAIVEAFRFQRDRTLLTALWPAIRRGALFLESLCRVRSGSKGLREATRGLLPESASHEGYLAQPVHSYWDDFWGVRGLLDAALAASELGHAADVKRFERSAKELMDAIQSSMRQVITSKGLDYIPGSVEWADFDPTATANALDLFSDTAGLPEQPLRAMFERFVDDSRKRRRGELPWKNYTAYEIRIVGALVRLGWRDVAWEFLKFYLSDRRLPSWNQWPEISWRDPRSPGHLGDVPHTWIGAEYLLVLASLFAYERESDSSLVVGAGIPAEWIGSRKVGVQGLSTWYGSLNLMLKRLRGGASALEMEIGGALRIPPGGIVLRPPCPAPIVRVEVDDEEFREFSSDAVHLSSVPARARIWFGESREAG